MVKISRLNSFKRDYKKLQKKHFDMTKIDYVITLLALEETETLVNHYRDHALTGNMKGIRELHIEGDWLLTYRYLDGNIELLLLNTGSHDYIFK